MATDLAHGRVGGGKAHCKDGVGLSDAALSPDCEARVALVEGDAVLVLQLCGGEGGGGLHLRYNSRVYTCIL